MLLIHCFGQDQTPLLMHVFKRRICIGPEYFINQIKPTLPGQKVIQMTQQDVTSTLTVANCTNVSIDHLPAEEWSGAKLKWLPITQLF